MSSSRFLRLANSSSKPSRRALVRPVSTSGGERGRRDIPQRLSCQERAQLIENGRRAERDLALDEARARGVEEVLARRAGAAAQLRKLDRLLERIGDRRQGRPESRPLAPQMGGELAQQACRYGAPEFARAGAMGRRPPEALVVQGHWQAGGVAVEAVELLEAV